MATEAEHSRIMDPRLSTVRWIGICFGLSALMFVQGAPLLAQQIPASELPLPGLIPGSKANTIRKMVSLNWCAANPRVSQ